jgi:hypothetical protein
MTKDEFRIQMVARINVMSRIQLWYLCNGCPPIDEIRAAGGVLAAAKALRSEIDYQTAEERDGH